MLARLLLIRLNIVVNLGLYRLRSAAVSQLRPLVCVAATLASLPACADDLQGLGPGPCALGCSSQSPPGGAGGADWGSGADSSSSAGALSYGAGLGDAPSGRNGGGTAGLSSSPDGGAGAPPSGGSGGTAGSAGYAMTGAGAPPCVPSPEVCNGRDDNCDQKIDEGCPSGFYWQAATERALIGDSQQGTEFSDTCAGDEVLVGFQVTAGDWVEQVTGVCRKLVVVADETKTPFEYSLQLGVSRALSPHPSTASGAITDLTCPNGGILVGLRLSQLAVPPPLPTGTMVPTLYASCVTPVVTWSAGVSSISGQGLIEIGPAAGSISMDQSFGQAWYEHDDVASPTFVVGLHGYVSAWLDRLGMEEATLGIELR